MNNTIANVSEFIKTVESKITTLFDAETLDQMAKETKFIQRSTNRITAIDFVKLMSLEILDDPMMSTDGLCDMLAKLSPSSQMSGNALQQRLASDGAVAFLSAVFDDALTQSLIDVFDQTPTELLAPFSRVWLQDSTQCQLHEQLADTFRGAGGSSSKSSLKLSLIYEHHHHQIHQIMATDGVTAENTVGEALIDMLSADDLVIRDLGYLTVDVLRQIDKKQAFFLSRLQKGIPVFITDDNQATPIDLPLHIEKKFRGQSTIDLVVYLGQKRFPVRLIAYRTPDEVVNQRRRRAHRVAQKRGRKPSDEYLNWITFTFYVTNVESEIWTHKVVGTIYRLRWQIELIFKQWKSLLRIDCLLGTNENRIRCLVFGRMITIVNMSMIFRCLCCYAYAVYQREPSLFKLTAWLLRGQRLAAAVHNHQIDNLLEAMIIAAPKSLFKQQRNRKTTQQLIEKQVEFLNSFREKSWARN